MTQPTPGLGEEPLTERDEHQIRHSVAGWAGTTTFIFGAGTMARVLRALDATRTALTAAQAAAQSARAEQRAADVAHLEYLAECRRRAGQHGSAETFENAAKSLATLRIAGLAKLMRPLIESVQASGRFVYVTTYYDGHNTPLNAALIFRTAEDATAFATLLAAAVPDAELGGGGA